MLASEPSDCIRSAEIMPLMKQYFPGVEIRPFGGGILQHAFDNNFYDRFDGNNDLHARTLRLLRELEVAFIESGEIGIENAFLIATFSLCMAASIWRGWSSCCSVWPPGLAFSTWVTEFGVAGRMFAGGAFRRHLNNQIDLRTFEDALASGTTPEDRWHTICDACRKFGFTHVELLVNGHRFEETLVETNGNPVWTLDIRWPMKVVCN